MDISNASRYLIASFCSYIILLTLPAGLSAQDFPATAGNDTIPWIGTFRIFIEPEFRSLMVDYPGYDQQTKRLQFPTLIDQTAIIGRSAPLTHGGPGDLPGVLVGLSGTLVSDLMLMPIPQGFQGPAGRREMHTEIRKLQLTESPMCGGVGLGFEVRSGTGLGLQLSPGEIEAISQNSDFSAEGFFLMYLEVDIPSDAMFPGGTLYNPNMNPILIRHDEIEAVPPTVVYYTGNLLAVPLLFRNDNPGFWDADDSFGYIVFTNQASNFTCAPDDLVTFSETISSELPLPPPYCQVSFEELPDDVIFENPIFLPEDQLFVENNVPIIFYEYFTLDTMEFLGHCNIEDAFMNVGFGHGQTFNCFFSSLEFDFTNLPYPVGFVSFEVVSGTGTTINFSVNNEQLHIQPGIPLLPDTISTGIEFRYIPTFSFPGIDIGIIELEVFDLEYPLSKFRIGGQDFLIDNICALDWNIATAITEVSQEELSHFKLNQNYPNPFSLQTTIAFEIPALWNEPVSLEIYNLQGQLIRTLVDGDLDPGKPELTWDGNDEQGNPVPSGIYLYRIASDLYSAVLKMYLIK